MRQSDRKHATRGALLAATSEAFAELTYDAATVDDIAARARLSKGAFYFHFSTKEDVLIELVRAWAGERTAALRAASVAPTPHGRLQRMLLALFEPDTGAPSPRLLAQYWIYAARDGEAGRLLWAARRTWRTMLRTAIGRAFPRNDVMSAREAADAILAQSDGLAVARLAPEEMAPCRDGRRAAALAMSVLGAISADYARRTADGTSALNELPDVEIGLTPAQRGE